jgi:hypothetical protein
MCVVAMCAYVCVCVCNLTWVMVWNKQGNQHISQQRHRAAATERRKHHQACGRLGRGSSPIHTQPCAGVGRGSRFVHMQPCGGVGRGSRPVRAHIQIHTYLRLPSDTLPPPKYAHTHY